MRQKGYDRRDLHQHAPDRSARRALLLLGLGLASALRRSELAALTVADLNFVAEGVTLAVARSKTDQRRPPVR